VRDELHAYADELLADGEWHAYYPVLTKIAARVQPGDAMRRAVSRSVSRQQRQHPGQEGRDAARAALKEIDVFDQLRAGSRHIAAQLLNSRRFEVTPRGRPSTDELKRVRLRRTTT
jgi:hypothetical protein